MWSVESFGLVAFEIFNIILSVFSLSFSSAGKGQFLTGKAKNCTPWGGRGGGGGKWKCSKVLKMRDSWFDFTGFKYSI